jgi:CubicO group peptidase (beta-lactamase class C family)
MARPRDVSSRNSRTLDTLYFAASTTKSFTSAAVSLLIDDEIPVDKETPKSWEQNSRFRQMAKVGLLVLSWNQ